MARGMNIDDVIKEMIYEEGESYKKAKRGAENGNIADFHYWSGVAFACTQSLYYLKEIKKWLGRN